MDVDTAKAAIADEAIFSVDQINALADMVDAIAAPRPKSGHPNISIVNFLKRWIHEPMPQSILDAGAEIMEDEDYTPEKRVHQIVQKCVVLWLEDAATS